MITSILLKVNPWWEDKPIHTIEGLPHRELYWKLTKTFLKERRIKKGGL